MEREGGVMQDKKEAWIESPEYTDAIDLYISQGSEPYVPWTTSQEYLNARKAFRDRMNSEWEK